MCITMPCRPASLLAVALLSALLPSALSIKPRAHGECLQSDEFTNPSVPTFKHFFIQSPEVEEGSRTVNVTVAEDYKVVYYDHFKVVENQRTETAYVLYHCGRERPADEDLPADLQSAANPGFNKFFPVPLNRISVPDTTAFAFLKALGLEDRISFVSEYTIDACAAKLFAEGDGECNKRSTYAASYPGFSGNPGKVDEVDAIFTSGANSDNEKVIAFTASQDPGVLKRAEWLKFMASFFNKEAEANELFNQISQDYNNVKDKVAQHLNSSGQERPLVAWLYYQPFGGGGFSGVPSYVNKIELKFTPYHAQYMEDMGGRLLDLESIRSNYVDGFNVVNKTSGGVTVPVVDFLNITDDTGEKLSEILQGVDYIIDETGHEFVSSTPVDADIDASHVADIFRLIGTVGERVRNGSLPIIRLDASKNPNGGTNWLQDAVPRPDQVLKEFASILWGNQLDFSLSTPSTLKIVRKLGETALTTVQKGECQKDDYQDCTLTSSLICPMLFIDCDGTVKAATEEQRCPPTVSECEVANSLEDTNSTKFERATVDKIKSVLNSARGSDSGVTSSSVRLISAAESDAASKRRALLDSHKAIEVSYAVFVQGGDSDQAAKDVNNALSTLTTEDASFWGSELEEFGIRSTTATTDDDGGDGDDGARGLRAGVLALGGAALLSAFALLA